MLLSKSTARSPVKLGEVTMEHQKCLTIADKFTLGIFFTISLTCFIEYWIQGSFFVVMTFSIIMLFGFLETKYGLSGHKCLGVSFLFWIPLSLVEFANYQSFFSLFTFILLSLMVGMDVWYAKKQK